MAGYMRILKNRSFSQWASKLKISDEVLYSAITEMQHGLYDANLGGNVYKKRLPFGHKGKSGGMRTIIAFKLNNRAIFVYGYAKSEKSTLTQKEAESLKQLAKLYFSYSDNEIKKAIEAGVLIEVHSNEKINT